MDVTNKLSQLQALLATLSLSTVLDSDDAGSLVGLALDLSHEIGALLPQQAAA